MMQAMATESSIAQQTLDAMEGALLKLAKGTNATVTFNGQTCTKKDLKMMQDAIAAQREVVAREDRKLALEAGAATGGGIRTAFGYGVRCGGWN